MGLDPRRLPVDPLQLALDLAQFGDADEELEIAVPRVEQRLRGLADDDVASLSEERLGVEELGPLAPALQAEGLAREFVRRVQELRKTANFEITDHIITYYVASEKLANAITSFADYIKNETLSINLIAGRSPLAAALEEDTFDDETLTLEVIKANTG